MPIGSWHPKEDLLRHLDGDVSAEEEQRLRDHLQECEECRGFVSFVEEFNEGLAELSKEEFTAKGPCPDSWTQVSYEAGALDEETARHVRAHMLLCEECTEIHYAFMRTKPKIIDVIIRVAQGLFIPVRTPAESEWELLPATSTLKKGTQVLAAPFQVRETAVDPDSGETSTVTFRLEEAVEPARMRLIVRTDTIPDEEGLWEILLQDAEQHERASMPLDKLQLEVHPALPYGLYRLEIRKTDEILICLLFGVEPFSLREAIDVANEYLGTGEYSRALAILDDAAERYPDSREILELRAVSRFLAWKDTEGFADDQMNIRGVLAAQDVSGQLVGALNEVKASVGESLAYVVSSTQLDPSRVPEDFERKVVEEHTPVTVLSALQIVLDRLERVEKRLEASDRRTLDLLNVAVRRLDEFPSLLEDLTRKIDAIRSGGEQDSDVKFHAIGEILQRFPVDVEAKGLSLPDLRPFFRDKLGEAGWSWLGGDVQNMLVTAEDLYWYLGKKPAYRGPDFSPSLLEYCRGLEVLFNDKLGRACVAVRNFMQKDLEVAEQVRRELPAVYLDKFLKPERGRGDKSIGLQDVAILLRMGQLIVSATPDALGNHATLFTKPLGPTPIEFFAVVSHVGVNIRNGKSHRSVTSASEMHLVRKLILGLDEEVISSNEVLSKVDSAPWLTRSEVHEVTQTLSASWRKYPGLVQILWSGLGKGP